MIPDPVSYETPLMNDKGKSSSLNPTNENGADKNNQHEKIENLTIELTALKLFVQEQFYIIKKQLEETIPESTKQLAFSSLRSETECLREENRTKTLIIKQLTENKAMMTCSCNVVSTSRGHANKNKEAANSLQKSNKNLNPTKTPNDKALRDNHNTENKDSNEKNRKTITEKKNDTENKDTKENKNIKKKDTENKDGKENKDVKKKDKESKKKEKEVKNKANGNNSPREKLTIYILGDSMIKKLNGYFLTKKVRHKYLIKVKVSCIVDHVKPTLRDDKPDHIILHAGTNDLRTEKTSSQIAKSIIDLTTSLKNSGNSVIVSGIVPRFDNLNNKATEVNSRLVLMCAERNIPFISHSESRDSSKHLNESKLHLNFNGVKVFAENFSAFLTKFD